jgi:hypothetical protein
MNLNPQIFKSKLHQVAFDRKENQVIIAALSNHFLVKK